MRLTTNEFLSSHNLNVSKRALPTKNVQRTPLTKKKQPATSLQLINIPCLILPAPFHVESTVRCVGAQRNFRAWAVKSAADWTVSLKPVLKASVVVVVAQPTTTVNRIKWILVAITVQIQTH